MNLLSKPRARYTHNVLSVCHISLVLSNAHYHTSLLELVAVSKAIPTSKVSLWRESLVDSAAWPPRYCASTLLQSEYVKTMIHVSKILTL